MYFHNCMVVTKTSSSLVMVSVLSSHIMGYGYTRNVVTDTVLVGLLAPFIINFEVFSGGNILFSRQLF